MMAVSGDPTAIEIFRSRYAELIRSAIRGHGLVRELGDRFGFRERSAPNLRSYGLKRGDFQSIGSRLSPLLRLPGFFGWPTSGTPLELLRNWIRVSTLPDSTIRETAERILAESFFAPGETRFRTEGGPGGAFFHASSDSTYSALAGAAHEFGHCLAERILSPSSKLPLFSESLAQLLEEWIVTAYLPDESVREEWGEFRRKVDRLNLYFEAFEAGRGAPNGARENGFDPDLLVFRETLFTAPGYQAIYAGASRFSLGFLNCNFKTAVSKQTELTHCWVGVKSGAP